MNVNKTPITFKNNNGFTLFGMLHTPEKIRKDIAIIILSPGIKSRVAPHRLYIKMAERFSELGFSVLRVDPAGLGDSEGEIREKFTADVYCSMELGRLIGDTISTMDWFENEVKVSRFILTGLCGGAITGLLAGAKDNRVDSVLGLGLTSILASSNLDPSRYITQGQLQNLQRKYIKKIINPVAWFRFLTFQSDYKIIYKSIILPIKKYIEKNEKKNEKSIDLQSNQIESNLNPHFPEAFIQMVSKRKLLLIFSEQDRLYWEFKEKFMKYYEEEIEQYRNNLEIYIVKNANHIFSFHQWQKDMLNKSCLWLIYHYGDIGQSC